MQLPTTLLVARSRTEAGKILIGGEEGEFASSLFILRIQAYRAFLDNFTYFLPLA